MSALGAQTRRRRKRAWCGRRTRSIRRVHLVGSGRPTGLARRRRPTGRPRPLTPVAWSTPGPCRGRSSGRVRRRAVGFVQYGKPQTRSQRPSAACGSSSRSACSAAPRWPSWPASPSPAAPCAPIAGLTRAATRGGAHAQPGRDAAQAASQRRGRRPGPHARGHAPRAERRARRDRGSARPPARVRGRRLARAAHPAHQHPGQPGAARDRAGRASSARWPSSALRSSRRMRRLVADLLLLARADAGRETPTAADRPGGRGPRGGRRRPAR